MFQRMGNVIQNWISEFGTIDIIVGGPPCQGLSLIHIYYMDFDDLKDYVKISYELTQDGLVISIAFFAPCGCRNRLFCITYAKQTREKFLFHSAFSEKPCKIGRAHV